MTSAEPSRKTPYGHDIAVRVVWQRLGMNLSFREIAKRLQIGVGTAHRLYQRFAQTDQLTPKKRSGSRPLTRKLDDLHELYIIALLTNNPGLYLAEMCEKIRSATGVLVSGSTVCRILQRNGYTRKKIVNVAIQRCDRYRGSFMAQTMNYPVDFFVWVDETGSDNRDHFRKFGYELRGLTPVYHRLLSRGTRVSCIVSMSSEGVLCYETHTGTVNGDMFFDFMRGTLLPNMQAFPASRSIVIMDNCSIHHVQHVKDLLNLAGILVIFLPLYSPDYNPCEELFSYAKYYLKDHDDILQSMHSHFHIQLLESAIESVTMSLCKKWIAHAGYEVP